MTRYNRQSLFKQIGQSGQDNIETKTVVIVGVGALGTVSSEMLARAGVKKLILIDRDYVEATNLQRQSLFTEADAHAQVPKVIAARDRLQEIRSDLEIDTYIEHCDAQLLTSVVKEADLILDGTDNFETRLLINDVAYQAHMPWIYAACVESTYVSCAFVPDKVSPCFRCLIPVLPSSTLTCDTAGIIAPAVHMAVSEQVTAALKILSGGTITKNILRMGDLWQADHMTIGTDALMHDECPTCKCREFPELDKTAQRQFSLCGRDTVQIIDNRLSDSVVADALEARGIDYRKTPYFIEFHYDETRIVAFQNGRLLVHGVMDVNKGQTIVNQIFG